MFICIYQKFISGKQLVFKVDQRPSPDTSHISKLNITVCGRTKATINDNLKCKQSPENPKTVQFDKSPVKIVLGSDKKGTAQLLLRWVPLNIAYSADDKISETNSKPVSDYLNEALYGLDIGRTAAISDTTTHFLKTTKLSSKLTLSMVKNLPIVSIEFVDEIKRQSKNFITRENYNSDDVIIQNRKLPRNTSLLEYDFGKSFPNFNEFVPEAAFKVNSKRKSLFDNLTFIITSQIQLDHLKDIIESASGTTKYFDLIKNVNIKTQEYEDALATGIDKLYKFCTTKCTVPNNGKTVFIKTITTDENDPVEKLHYKIMRKTAEKLGVSLITNKEFFVAIKDINPLVLLKQASKSPSVGLAQPTAAEFDSASATAISDSNGSVTATTNKKSRRKRVARSQVRPLDTMALFVGSPSPVPPIEVKTERESSDITILEAPRENKNASEPEVKVEDVPDHIVEPLMGAFTNYEPHTESISNNEREKFITKRLKDRQKTKRLSNILLKNLPSAVDQIVTSTGEPTAENTPRKAKLATPTSGASTETPRETQTQFSLTQRRRKRVNNVAIDDLFNLSQGPAKRQEAEPQAPFQLAALRADVDIAAEISNGKPNDLEKELQSEFDVTIDDNQQKSPSEKETAEADHVEKKGSKTRNDAKPLNDIKKEEKSQKLSLEEAVKNAKEAEKNKIKQDFGVIGDAQINNEEIEKIRRGVKVEEFEVKTRLAAPIASQQQQHQRPHFQQQPSNGTYRDWSTRKNFKRFVKHKKGTDKAQLARSSSGYGNSIYKAYVSFDTFDPTKENEYAHVDEDEDFAMQNKIAGNNVGQQQSIEVDSSGNNDNGDDSDAVLRASQFRFSRSQSQGLFVDSEEEDNQDRISLNIRKKANTNTTTTATTTAQSTQISNAMRIVPKRNTIQNSANGNSAQDIINLDEEEEEDDDDDDEDADGMHNVPKFRFRRG